MTGIKQIEFTPTPVVSKADPELASQLHGIHQQVFLKLNNHFAAIQNLQSQINALKAAQGKK